MSSLFPTRIQTRPLAVPVEGDAVRSLIDLVELSELVVLDGASTLDIEEAEGNLIFRIGLDQEVLERAPVLKVDLASVLSICNSEEDRILFSLYLVLREGMRISSCPLELWQRISILT